MREVNPYNEYEKEGKTYGNAYDFDRVHLDEVDISKIAGKGVEVRMEEGGPGIVWNYRDKIEVTIREKRVVAPDDSPVDLAGKTAYFALWKLDDLGYVSGFRKL